MNVAPNDSAVLAKAGIAEFVHAERNPRGTRRRQANLLRRWELERDRLHAATKLDPELLDQMQLSKVRQIVDSAFITHPFYHRLYRDVGYSPGDVVTWDDYNSLPVVSKSQLVEFNDDFCRRLLGSENCYNSRTSGSSGNILTIIQDDGTTLANVLYYMRYYEQVLGRSRLPDEWVYRIYLSSLRFPSLLGRYPVFTLSQHCPAERAVEHLTICRPIILKAFPSYLERMMTIDQPLSDLGVQAICTHSEASTAEEREQFAIAFGVNVVADEYSSEELYLIATQCRFQSYHLVEDNVRVDVLATTPLATSGEIVATSLTNQYMPLIRYLQGDVVELDRTTTLCKCGSTFRMMKKFHGRTDDQLLRSDGSLLEPDRVMGLYNDTLLLDGSGVAEFMIHQIHPGNLELLLRPSDRGTSMDMVLVEKFKAGLRMLYTPDVLALAVRTVESMPNVGSGKGRIVISDH